MMSFLPWSGRAEPADDATLAARIAAGDAAALDQVYRRESGPVYRYALALCGNAAWAADATQDAFMQLAQRPLGFDAHRGALGAWLAGIARHHVLALWREPAVAAEPDDDPVDAALPGGESPEAVLVRRQDNDTVWAAIRELPWGFREALILVDLQERSYAEAAQIAGIELNTLRTRVHRARARLAQQLAPVSGEQ